MTFEELRDNHRVVKDGIGAQLVIPPERHDETRQIVTGDRVDLLQVIRDGYMERSLLRGFAGRFEAGYTETSAFQFVALAPLHLQRLSCGYARAFPAPRPAHVPLDLVAAVGQSVPVVVAFGITGNGKHLLSHVRFDAFDDVDPGHNFSPAIRIKRTAGKTANEWKLQKTKSVGRSWHSTTQLLPHSVVQPHYSTSSRAHPGSEAGLLFKNTIRRVFGNGRFEPIALP